MKEAVLIFSWYLWAEGRGVPLRSSCKVMLLAKWFPSLLVLAESKIRESIHF
jgi:hypothetical protein